MTYYELEQFKAKQMEDISHNTYCGQCGDIIKQKCPWYFELLLLILTFGFAKIKPPITYKCKCWWEATNSPKAINLLKRFNA